jgi:Putative transposase/Transposase zinc-binding domain
VRVEIADIFRIHGPDYREKYGERMLPSHLKAREDIERCRTAALGGQLYSCEHCGESHYSYHSCKTRHCPKCQNDQAEAWLENQKRLLLPVTHFMVTFTLPAELRALTRSHQKTLYNILFRASAKALQELATDPRFIGGRIGMVGVLHTWTRDLRYHPHVHYIVPGGGLSAEATWLPSRQEFLVHVKPLSVLFRAKVRAHLQETDLFPLVNEQVWNKDWVVHCEPVGCGEAAFRYLAPYLFRVALSNNRILGLAEGKVTVQYKESATAQIEFSTVSAEELIRRFLQHVLPDRFVKVRYYGVLSPGHRHLLNRARQLLGASALATNTTAKAREGKVALGGPRCPKCGSVLILLEILRPQRGLKAATPPTGRWPP